MNKIIFCDGTLDIFEQTHSNLTAWLTANLMIFFWYSGVAHFALLLRQR